LSNTSKKEAEFENLIKRLEEKRMEGEKAK
jgi:hypothetical protein